MKIMKVFMRSVLLLGFIAITTQDISGGKGCDCSVCKGVHNKLSPVVRKKIGDEVGGKSSCNICEHRKEMLRLEREKQRQLQKCPFEILGDSALKGKTSEEIFEEFRELVAPSQNGFFDMMRGVVQTMHVSSVAELKWAREKEAKELAKKRKEEEAKRREELRARRAEEARKWEVLKSQRDEEARRWEELRSQREEEARKWAEFKSLQEEEARKREELKHKKDETPHESENRDLNNPIMQTPDGQTVVFGGPTNYEIMPMIKRIPKEPNKERYSVLEQEALDLQPIERERNDQVQTDYLDINSKDNLLHADVIQQLIGYNMLTSTPQNEVTESTTEEDLYTFGDGSTVRESTTVSPFVKFVTNEEMKAMYGRKTTADDFGFNLFPTNVRL